MNYSVKIKNRTTASKTMADAVRLTVGVKAPWSVENAVTGEVIVSHKFGMMEGKSKQKYDHALRGLACRSKVSSKAFRSNMAG